jgi:SulP family sulfate permease
VDILRIDGSLFFGAVEHVRDALETARRDRPDVRHVLLVATAINFVDVAGATMLGQVAREMREAGSLLHVSGLKPQVRDVLERSGAIETIGRERVFDTERDALEAISGSREPA